MNATECIIFYILLTQVQYIHIHTTKNSFIFHFDNFRALLNQISSALSELVCSSESEPPSVPFVPCLRTNSGLRERKLSACQMSMALVGSKSLMSGEHNWVFRRSERVSPFRRERQSLFTCFITLNPHLQSAVVAGMVRRALERLKMSGHAWRSILFTVGQVFSKVPVAGSDSIMHMQTIIFKCNFSY